VAGLAAEAGLSLAPSARRFTTLVGQPPLTYLTWWRMTTAARLLRDTAAPLRSVAAEAGYPSEFAFPPLGVPPRTAAFLPVDRQYRDAPSHVPYESPDRTHAVCTPDTTWAVNGQPPDSSQGKDQTWFRCHLTRIRV
jgi:AraC-like DNA-binding protein